MSSDTRRGFLGAIFLAGGAASLLSACGPLDAPPQPDVSTLPAYTPQAIVAPPEIVPLRPGVSYANVRPTRVPDVRRLAQ